MRFCGLLTVLGFVLFAAASACAQCGDPLDPWKLTWSDYVRVCRKYGGHIANRRCVDWNTNWCGHGNQPAVDYDAARRQAEEAEQRSREAENRRILEEQRLKEEEQKRREEQFRSERDEAARSLKGVSSSEVRLKGENSSSFGIKGMSAAEASGEIKTSEPSDTSREISSAWQQIRCAAEIGGIAISKAKGLDSHPSGATVDEIRYLVSEASNALHGNPVGVECSHAPPVKFTKTPDIAATAKEYDAILGSIVKSAQNLYQSSQKSEAAKQKIEQAKTQLKEIEEQLPGAKTKPTAKSGSKEPPVETSDQAKIAAAKAEQDAYKRQDQQRINAIYEKQKEQQQKKLDALSVLRQAQALQNEANSKKFNAKAQLDKDEARSKALLDGNLATPAAGKSQ